jgi:hypothetical protein
MTLKFHTIGKNMIGIICKWYHYPVFITNQLHPGLNAINR